MPEDELKELLAKVENIEKQLQEKTERITTLEKENRELTTKVASLKVDGLVKQVDDVQKEVKVEEEITFDFDIH